MTRRKAFAGTIMLAAIIFSAPLVQAGERRLHVEGAHIRQPGNTSGPAVAYMTISNHGETADRLLSITSARAAKAELHRTQIDSQGIARMEMVPGLDLPAGATVALAPGGYHIMLMEVMPPLEAGQTVPLDLVFEHAGTLRLTLPVTVMGAGMKSHDHRAHSHDTHSSLPHGQTRN